MEYRANFLSLMLIDALEDENAVDIYAMLERNNINASFVAQDRGIAPIHYVCGMSNEKLALDILKRFLESGADPNVRCDSEMTPLHIAALYGRVELVRVLLEYGAQLEVFDDENKTPINYAIQEFHFEVLELMRDHIFVEKFDRQAQRKKLSRTSSLKKDTNGSQDQDQSLTNGKFEQQLRRLNSEVGKSSTPRSACINKQLLTVETTSSSKENDKYTPNRIHYNYDVTSPYYIHVTHRRHKPQPVYPPKDQQPHVSFEETEKSDDTRTPPVNIFSLTKENLAELTHNAKHSEQRSRVSLIDNWRSKVERSRARQSLLQQYENMEQLVDEALQNDDFDLLEYQKSKVQSTDVDSGADTLNESVVVPPAKTSSSNLLPLNEVVQAVANARVVKSPRIGLQTCQPGQEQVAESSYYTVPDVNGISPQRQHLSPPDVGRDQLIRSPKNDEYFLQMTEAYVHTDDENGLVFYETKLLNNVGNQVAQASAKATTTPKTTTDEHDTTATSHSTNLTMPLDYETDQLRAELTQFGESVGPITKSTKRLYIKRLIKYKRNTAQMLELRKHAKANEVKYSVELQRTLRLPEFERISEYLAYEKLSAAHFAGQHSVERRQMREGHLKQSFIYMLIDPAISCNLPGESIFLDKFTVWQRFLDAIFYVGKGKSSRPYAHLYEAMKTHTRVHQKHVSCAEATRQKLSVRKQAVKPEAFKSPPPAGGKLSKKLARILNIWQRGQGVVCLHVFHNIMPTDAYTREAAIIDALSLKQLTNMKRGDYYGPAHDWTMRDKKYLGIALLYKALHIYLAEGESQLSPSDLI